MAQHSHVPKFGNWESGDNVPYTAYFDKARKGRTGTKMTNPNDPEQNPDFLLDKKMTNPNDPEQNPDLLLDKSSSADLPPSKPRADSKEPAGKGSVRSNLELQKSIESDPNDSFGSPARSGGHSVGSADSRRKPARPSAEYSIERSPLHRQARTPSRDSPSWEGKNSYDSSHGTPGRSRLRQVNRGDETPDRGAAVPKFGEWDEGNPSSAEGFTHIFNKVREEKQGGGGHASGTPTRRPYIVNRPSNDKAQSCCFGWCKK